MLQRPPRSTRTYTLLPCTSHFRSPLPALLTMAEARAEQSLIEPTQRMARGNAAAALGACPHRLSGRFEMGGQDHFYLEGQVAVAMPGEDGQVHVLSSSQHPSEVQHLVAHMLHRSSAEIGRAHV